MTGRKPRVLLFFTYRRAAEGLDADNLRPLLDGCDVDVLLGSDRIEGGFAGRPTKGPFEITGWRFAAWYVLFYRRFLVFLDRFDRDWFAAAHLYKGVPPHIEKAIRLLWKTRLLPAAAGLLRLTLDRRNLLADTLAPGYDLVIAYTGIKDPRYDELARWARRRRIPILVVPINWDNLSSKPFVEPPDYLGVWGQQAQYFARLYHQMPFERSFVLGAARFEPHYRLEARDKKALRRMLGLPAGDGPLLLFAGAGANFDEIPLLNDLEDAIAARRIDPTLRVVFKPHPMRHRGPVEADPSYRGFTHVHLWTGLPEGVAGDENSLLLAAADGILSPYSTMVLEAAYFALPAVNMFYNDSGHSQSDWEVYGRHPNLLPMFAAPWNIECRSRATFVARVAELLTMIGDPRVAEAAQETFRHCVHIDRHSYGHRLMNAVEAILSGRSAIEVAAESWHAAPDPIPEKKAVARG
jgi:hypothetical protein